MTEPYSVSIPLNPPTGGLQEIDHEKSTLPPFTVQHDGIDRTKIRISLDVSPEFYQTLNLLAQQSGTTKSEILRKAIALIDIAFKVKQSGQKLGVVAKETSVDTEIIGI